MSISLNPNQFGFLSPDSGRSGQSQESSRSAATTQPTDPVAKEVLQADRQTAQQTADNMLGFIGRGVESLRSAGASESRIADRIAAAREGVARGYAEAEEILEARGMLTDELKQEIDAGRAMIEEGINQLERGESLSANTVQAVASSNQLKVANAFSLDVVTRDGDTVKVSFSQSEQRSSSSAPGLQQFASASQSAWEFEVQGHLDEDEQQALSSLFNSVQDLSERFFGGDLGGALEQAMSLGFDGNELASLSLNLTQQTFVSTTRAYSDIQPQLPTEQLEGIKAPLASYVDAYLAAIDKASALKEPEQTLQDLVNNLLPEEERLPIWNEFHQGLATATRLSGLLNTSE